jgi:hypothetical protein
MQAIERYAAAGFDEVYIQQIGGHHDRFFELYSREVLPRFHDAGEPARDEAEGGEARPDARRPARV